MRKFEEGPVDKWDIKLKIRLFRVTVLNLGALETNRMTWSGGGLGGWIGALLRGESAASGKGL